MLTEIFSKKFSLAIQTFICLFSYLFFPPLSVCSISLLAYFCAHSFVCSSELVRELYPRKPQLVEQKALPLLWHLLGTSRKSGTIHGRSGTMRGVTTNLCQALHAHMGPMLLNQAASQPSNILKSLNEILQTFTPLWVPWLANNLKTEFSHFSCTLGKKIKDT